jgi:hypothetical protein
MKARFPVLLTSLLAVGLAAPTTATDKPKDKDKDKKKDKVERVDRHRDGRDDRDDRHDDDHDGKGRITICHIPPGNAAARHTITVSESAWDAHRKHGDRRGACDHHGDGDGRGDAFDRLDRDNDGRLVPGEWPHGNDSFRRLDRDGDGFLSRGEYGRY